MQEDVGICIYMNMLYIYIHITHMFLSLCVYNIYVHIYYNLNEDLLGLTWSLSVASLRGRGACCPGAPGCCATARESALALGGRKGREVFCHII